MVTADLDDLKAKLRRAAVAIRQHPDRELDDPSGVYFAVGEVPGEVCLPFPGQGSQYVGMRRDLALHFDDARAVRDRAADLVFDGSRLHVAVFPPTAFGEGEEKELVARLTRTEWAPPGPAACSIAAPAVLRRLGLEPLSSPATASASRAPWARRAPSGCPT